MKARWISLLLFSLACGKDSTSSSAGGIPAASVTGTWTFILGDSIACGDSVQERSFDVVVSGTQDDVEPAGSLSFTNTWASPSHLTGTVYGTFNLQNDIVILHLTMTDTLTHGLELVGRLDDTLALHGRATDPYPGYAPMITATGCKFDFSGSRTGN
jgi:hypothetical protein